jgi:hypothetical protein
MADSSEDQSETNISSSTPANPSVESHSDPPLVHAVVCPLCGAPGDADLYSCWLCKYPRTTNPYTSIPYASRDVPIAEGAARSETLLVLLIAGCFLLAFFVVLGLMSGSAGLLVLVAVIAVPAFAVALPHVLRGSGTATSLAETSHTAMYKPYDVVMKVLLSFAIAGGVIALMIIAAGILLFLVCLSAISGLGPSS